MKIMKTLCIGVLVAAMALSLLACGGGSGSQGGAGEASLDRPALPTNFDQKLVGSWHIVSSEHLGETEIDLGYYIYFLYDGRFYGHTLLDYANVTLAGQACPQATASNGTTDMLDQYFAFEALTNPRLDPSTIDLQTTYTVENTDVAVSPYTEGYAPYFAKYDNDLLTLHITGTVLSEEGDSYTVDSTLIYEKEYPLCHPDYLHPSLEGTWQDNKGNVWEFFFKDDPNAGYKDEIKVKMTEPDGTVHEGGKVGVWWMEDDPDCKEDIRFYFNDERYDSGTIIEYDGVYLAFEGKEITTLVRIN